MPGTPLPTINGVTLDRQLWKRIVDRLLPDTAQPNRSANLKRLARLDKEVRQKVRALAVEFLREGCVLAEPETVDDWLGRLEAVRTVMAPPKTPASPPVPPIQPTPEKVLETAAPLRQDAPGTTAETLRPHSSTQNVLAAPADRERCNQCGLILCRCPKPVVLGGSEEGVDARELFPGLSPENTYFWRRQANDEQDERAALIRQLSSREPKF